jgi:hypothetical protein
MGQKNRAIGECTVRNGGYGFGAFLILKFSIQVTQNLSTMARVIDRSTTMKGRSLDAMLSHPVC